MAIDGDARLPHLRQRMAQLAEALLEAQPLDKRNDEQVVVACKLAAFQELDTFANLNSDEYNALEPDGEADESVQEAITARAHDVATQLWGDVLEVDGEQSPPVPSPAEIHRSVLAEISSSRAVHSADVERFSQSHGSQLPDELRTLIQAAPSDGSSPTRIGSWAVRVTPPFADFESWVEEQQEEPSTERVFLEYFANLVAIGDAPNGDLYYAFAGGGPSAKAEVYWLDHEQGSLLEPALTDSIETFATQNWLMRKAAEPDSALTSAVERLKGKSSLGFHFRELEALVPGESFAERYESQTAVLALAKRARPWMTLLREGRVAKSLKANVQQYRERPEPGALRENVPELLYWLCRDFFSRDAKLAETLKACASNAAPILRSAAEVFSRLNDGSSKTLGKIPDVAALREQVVRAIGAGTA